MAITKEILDKLLKGCHGHNEFYGHDGLVKQLSKALIERMMQAELTEQLGYEKSEPGEKETENRHNDIVIYDSNSKTTNNTNINRKILNYSKYNGDDLYFLDDSNLFFQKILVGIIN
jgi:transposase-like protein